jgi:signal transduction histidine kinase
MKNKLWIALFIYLFLSIFWQVLAQETQIKGIVVDEGGKPLGGNSVKVSYQTHTRTPNATDGRFVLYITGNFDKTLLKVIKKDFSIKEIQQNPSSKEIKIVMWNGSAYTGILLDENGNPRAEATITFKVSNYEEKSATNRLGKFDFHVPKDIEITKASHFEVNGNKVAPENIHVDIALTGNTVILDLSANKVKDNAEKTEADKPLLSDKNILKTAQSQQRNEKTTSKKVNDSTTTNTLQALLLKDSLDKQETFFQEIVAELESERERNIKQNKELKEKINLLIKPLQAKTDIDKNQKENIRQNLSIIRDNLIENEQVYELMQENTRLFINELTLLLAEKDSLKNINLMAIKKLDSVLVAKEKMERENMLNQSRSQQNLLVIGLLALFLAVLTVGFYIIGRRERKDRKELAIRNSQLALKNEEIQKQSREINTLNNEMTQANEELRQQQEELEVTNEQLEKQNAEILRQKSMIETQKLRAEVLASNLEKEVRKKTYKIQTMLDDMTKQNEDLKQFSYIISHNIRSPIAHLLGLLHIFNKEDLSDPFNREVLMRLETSSQNLDMVIRDLTQIVAVRNDLNKIKEKVNVKELIDLEKIMLKSEIENAKASILENLTENSEIFSIKSYTQSIIHNLLSNAIKYKSEVRPLEIKIQTAQEGRFLCITVQDNGMGMELNQTTKQKLFGLYQRMHDHVEGKGLGLYMVKTQIEALGGKIGVESELNKGTTFTVYFPKNV